MYLVRQAEQQKTKRTCSDKPTQTTTQAKKGNAKSAIRGRHNCTQDKGATTCGGAHICKHQKGGNP